MLLTGRNSFWELSQTLDKPKAQVFSKINLLQPENSNLELRLLYLDVAGTEFCYVFRGIGFDAGSSAGLFSFAV